MLPLYRKSTIRVLPSEEVGLPTWLCDADDGVNPTVDATARTGERIFG